MIDNNEIVCLDKQFAKMQKEMQFGNFRDGSRPDIDELRKLRDKAHDFVSNIQKKIDDEIQKANGWDNFKGTYIRVINNEHIYMHVLDISRLYYGCTLIGDAIIAYDNSYFVHKGYDMEVNKPSDVEIITKEEFDNFVKQTIESISI